MPGEDYSADIAAVGAQQDPTAQRQASVAALFSPVAKPDAAAQALATGPAAGMPPASALANPAQAEGMATARRAATISQNSPPMAQWAGGDPVKVAATHDDFSGLSGLAAQAGHDAVAGFFGGLKNVGDAWTAMQRNLGRGNYGGAALDALNAAGSLADPITQPFTQPVGHVLAQTAATQPMNVPVLKQLNAAVAKTGIFNPEIQQAQTVEGRTSFFTQNLNMLAQVALGEGVARGVGAARGRPGTALGDVRAPGDGSAATAPETRPPVDPGPAGYATTPDAHVAAADGSAAQWNSPQSAARWILDEGHVNSNQNFEIVNGDAPGTYRVAQRGSLDATTEVPSPGVSETADNVRGVMADVDANRLADLEDAAANTKTLGRSPELLQEFLENQTPGETVSVAPEALAKVYESGATPFLDKLPDIQAAAERGADVELPLSQYVTEAAGQPWADELRQSVRVRDDGFSQAEAAERGGSGELAQDSSAAVQPELSAEPAQTDAAAAAARLGENDPRYLAESSQEKVQQLVKAAYLKQLFQTPEAAGMLKTQFDRYSERIENAIAAATEKMHQRVAAQIKRERGPQWQEALTKHLADTTAEVNALRPIEANRQLKQAGYKLDRAKVAASYPIDAPGFPQNMLKANGNDPDDVAEFLGYDSGGELVRDIADLQASIKHEGVQNVEQYVKKVAAREAETRTRAQLGWDFSPADIERAASEALSGPEVTDFLAEELQQLAKSEGLPFDKATLQARAMEMFGDLPLKQALKIKEFERLVGRHGRNAEVGLLKGKPGDAFISKQHQLINIYMLSEAHKLTREYSSAMSKWTGYAKQASIKTMDQSWLNHIHQSLIQMGFRVRRDPAELASQLNGQTLADFAEEKEGQGHQIVWTDIPEKAPEAQTVTEFRGARDTIASLAQNGRAEKTVETLQGRQELADLIDEIKTNADSMGRKLTPNRLEKISVGGTAGRAYRGILAPNIRMEQLFDDLDRDNPLGPLSRSVTEPLQKAKGLENDLVAKFSKEMAEFIKTQPKGWEGSMRDRMAIPELRYRLDGDSEIALTDDNSEPRITLRGELIRAMLNMGTESNYQKLLRGYGWDQNTFEDVVARHARKEDWDFVQKIWDMHESMWPQIESTYRRVAGVAPTKLPNRTIQTPHGEYAGGYFPIRYDPLRAPERKVFDSDSIFGGDYNSALPSNPYTKGRTGYTAPLTLNFDGIMTGLAQTIHDLAFREPLMQANRIISSPIVQRAVQDNYGDAFKKQLTPWLEYVARNKVSSDASSEWLASFVRRARSNMTFVGLAYRFSSAMKHGGIAAADSIGEVGAPRLLSAVRDLYASPAQMKHWQNFVLENSPEIRNRLVNVDRDIRDQVQKLSAKQNGLDVLQHYGYHMIGFSDNLSAMPTWLAAQRKAIEDGHDLLTSYAIGDKAVRKAHGSSAPVDLPAILRGGRDALGELGRLGTMFLSFMNHALNRMWRTGRLAGEGLEQAKAGEWAGARRNFEQAAARSFAYLVIPAAWLAEVSAIQHRHSVVPKGGDIAAGIVHNTVGAIPGVGTLFDVIERGDASAPLTEAMKNTKATVWNAFNVSPFGRHDKISKRWLRQALDTSGYFTGATSDQMGQSAQYLWDYSTGKEKPKDVSDAILGFGFGPKAREHR